MQIWKNLRTEEILRTELSFEELMEMDAMQCLMIDGEIYQRQVSKELEEKPLSTSEAKRIANHGVTRRRSMALGVHPDQVKEAREHAKTIHSGIDFLPNGDVEYSSKGARDAHLKANGYYDKDAYY